jgi:predicted amidophosphoribosyltransferase
MTKHCNNCGKDFDCTLKKCPVCGEKLKTHYTEEESAQIQKENDDVAAITMFL